MTTLSRTRGGKGLLGSRSISADSSICSILSSISCSSFKKIVFAIFAEGSASFKSSSSIINCLTVFISIFFNLNCFLCTDLFLNKYSKKR
uniref:Uncharacterized protein n=1 Tax=Meloidogyne enterolobii TaxID=390850 RepID=A0A6V7TMZ7_MELEN|nr:unnamed protein product [Meloidogyne enterolobii]